MLSSREENVSQMLNNSLLIIIVLIYMEKNVLRGHWTDEAELYSSCHIQIYDTHLDIFKSSQKHFII